MAAAVVATGLPDGIAVAADFATAWAAESMAELRMADAWWALSGDIPAWTRMLAWTEAPVPDELPESARAALPTEPATTQKPATRAPSRSRRRAKRDVDIGISFLARPSEAGTEL